MQRGTLKEPSCIEYSYKNQDVKMFSEQCSGRSRSCLEKSLDQLTHLERAPQSVQLPAGCGVLLIPNFCDLSSMLGWAVVMQLSLVISAPVSNPSSIFF